MLQDPWHAFQLGKADDLAVLLWCLSAQAILASSYQLLELRCHSCLVVSKLQLIQINFYGKLPVLLLIVALKS